MAKYTAEERRAMAKRGSAMPNGGYPIADEEDLRNAIHAVGRGGGSHNAIRKHIITRARSLGKSSLIPDNWNSDGSLKGAAAVRRTDASPAPKEPQTMPTTRRGTALASPPPGAPPSPAPKAPAGPAGPDAAPSDQAGPFQPAAYSPGPDDPVQCPACECMNGLDSQFCDQCGAGLAGNPEVIVVEADDDGGFDDGADELGFTTALADTPDAAPAAPAAAPAAGAPAPTEPSDGSTPAIPSGSTGAMVAMFPDNPTALALPSSVAGAIDAAQLHCTVAYLGEAADITGGVLGSLRSTVGAFAANYTDEADGDDDVDAVVEALSLFGDDGVGQEAKDTLVLLLNGVDLLNINQQLREPLAQIEGLTLPDDHPVWFPHISVATGETDLSVAASQVGEKVKFTTISLVVGTDRIDYTLGAPNSDDGTMTGDGSDTDAKDDSTPAAAPTPPPAPTKTASTVIAAGSSFAADEARWSGVLVVEDTPSGDGRMFAANALTWRDLPLPLMLMTRNPVGGGGHDGAELAGTIDRVWRDGNAIWGAGDFDLGCPAGQEAARLVSEGRLRGVSVDVDSAVYDFENAIPNDVPGLLDGFDPGMQIFSAGRVMGACYDDETEVLTELRGWQKFDALTPEDRVASRNPKTAEFEWAQPTYYHHDKWDGPMIRFTSGGVQSARNGKGGVRPNHRALDLLVTPNHRMLVTSTKTGRPVFMPAEELITKSNRSYIIPTVSEWLAPDVETFRIPGRAPVAEGLCACGCGGATRTRERWEGSGRGPGTSTVALPGHGHGYATEDLVLDGDQFAAMMGAYLSEGSRWGDKGFVISQRKTSKGYIKFKDLFDKMWPESWYGNGVFQVGSVTMSAYLKQFGTALQKFVPPELKAFSARQLRIFLEYFIAGDGSADGRRLFTSSPRMADDLVEIAQKCGMWAVVSVRTPPDYHNVKEDRWIRSNGPHYVIQLRNRPGSRPAANTQDWKAEWVENHKGDVRCVSVPNEALYVRRNGIPTWCGNTLCPFPALQEASVSIEVLDVLGDANVADEGQVVDPALVASAGLPADGKRIVRAHTAFVSDDDGRHALVASAGGNGVPIAPPAAWFARPKNPVQGPVRITSDGRLSGYVATFDSCHIGFADQCVRPPKGDGGYSHFRTGQVITAEGTVVNTGPLIIDSVHPNLRMRASDAQAFYAHTGSAFADVAVYDDDYGIYVAGAVRPTATPEQIRVARGSDWSPDWREIGGRLRMCALLAVNNTGFKVPALAASAGKAPDMILPGRPRVQMDLQTGRVSALVAAGMIHRGDTARQGLATQLAEALARIEQLEEFVRPQKVAAARLKAQQLAQHTPAARKAKAAELGAKFRLLNGGQPTPASK